MKDGKMLAWIKEPNIEGLTKVECNIPEVTDNNVIVKVKCTGICGTDLGIYKGYRKVGPNLIPGHEFCGEIIKLGKNVKGYEIGELVVPSIIHTCGNCWSCINGYEAQCENLEEIGIHINGSFAEFVSVPAITLHKVPKDLNVEKAASIEPVAVAYSAVKKAEALILGADVMVFGPGAIGLYISQVAKIAGAARVILVGVAEDEKRLKIAGDLGIQTINSSKQNMQDEMEKTFPKGKASIVFDATGVASIVGGMLKYLLPHGRLILAGIYHDTTSIDFLELVRGEISIKGTFCYTLSEFEGAVRLVKEDKINFEGIVDVLDFEQLKEGFENAIDKKSLKVILKLK